MTGQEECFYLLGTPASELTIHRIRALLSGDGMSTDEIKEVLESEIFMEWVREASERLGLPIPLKETDND